MLSSGTTLHTVVYGTHGPENRLNEPLGLVHSVQNGLYLGSNAARRPSPSLTRRIQIIQANPRMEWNWTGS